MSKKPLLKAEGDDIINRDNYDEDSILENTEHSTIRLSFLVLSQVLIFVLGGGFYTFPMWLNFILPDYISLSRSELTLLGGVPFIGLLGTSGGIILYINSLKFDKTFEFLFMNLISAMCIVVAWSMLAVLVLDTPSGGSHGNIVLIGFVLLLMGNAVGCYFTVWLGKLFPLMKMKYHFVFSCILNLSFATGSIVTLALKLIMNIHDWMIFMLVVQVAAVGVSFVFVCVNSKYILLNRENVVVPTEVSTKRLIIELLTFKREFSNQDLATKDCEVTSSQFYWIILSFASSCALATTFMANLGPLLSEDSSGGSDDESNFRDELIVLIWASVGQTIARVILPVTAHNITLYMTKMAEESNRFNTPREKEITQMQIRNRLTLTLTLCIGVLFFVVLMILRYSDALPFAFATAITSGAYGSMWVVNNTFPLFFPKYNFAILLSFFQFFGMFSMIVLVVIITCLKLNNNGVFMLLVVVAVTTIIISITTLVKRVATEPKLKYDALLTVDNDQ